MKTLRSGGVCGRRRRWRRCLRRRRRRRPPAAPTQVRSTSKPPPSTTMAARRRRVHRPRERIVRRVGDLRRRLMPALGGCTDATAVNFGRSRTARMAAACTPAAWTAPPQLRRQRDAPRRPCDGAAVAGCTDGSAANYYAGATADDGRCVYSGCTDSSRGGYDASAGVDDGSCAPLYPGCTDPAAENYHAEFAFDGSCAIRGCTDVLRARTTRPPRRLTTAAPATTRARRAPPPRAYGAARGLPRSVGGELRRKSRLLARRSMRIRRGGLHRLGGAQLPAALHGGRRRGRVRVRYRRLHGGRRIAQLRLARDGIAAGKLRVGV